MITRRGLFAAIAAAFVPVQKRTPTSGISLLYCKPWLIRCVEMSKSEFGELYPGRVERTFAEHGTKIGDVITIRKPPRYITQGGEQWPS